LTFIPTSSPQKQNSLGNVTYQLGITGVISYQTNPNDKDN
jgi:hypothetical protein